MVPCLRQTVNKQQVREYSHGRKWVLKPSLIFSIDIYDILIFDNTNKFSGIVKI